MKYATFMFSALPPGVQAGPVRHVGDHLVVCDAPCAALVGEIDGQGNVRIADPAHAIAVAEAARAKMVTVASSFKAADASVAMPSMVSLDPADVFAVLFGRIAALEAASATSAQE